MPVQTSYPGVYVQEISSGVHPVVGVSTSTALFIGYTNRGPIDIPIECTNYTVFKKTFGEDPGLGQLANYVKLFFLNGGTLCYVMRIAAGATTASITLSNELKLKCLELQAQSPGLNGGFIRAKITYRGSQPEATFSMDIFQWSFDSQGNQSKINSESWSGLSMNPNSITYAPTFLSQNSSLVVATDLCGIAGNASASPGWSLSGRAVPDASGATPFETAWSALLGSTVKTNTFQIRVGIRPPVNVDLSTFVVTDVSADLANAVQTAITTAYTNLGYAGVVLPVSVVGTATGRRLQISAMAVPGNEDVYITPGLTTSLGQVDLSASLMLGTTQGGIEKGAYADCRPASNGITLRAADVNNILYFDGIKQQDFKQITLEAVMLNTNALVSTVIPFQPFIDSTGATDPFDKDAYSQSSNGNSDGLREKLAIIAQLINNPSIPAGQIWPWQAELWGYRLAILPKDSTSDNFLSSLFAIGATTAFTGFINNVHLYSTGISGAGAFQTLGAAGSDGAAPAAADYNNAYPIIDQEVDLFNLMILPPVASPAPDATVDQLYGNASVFCQQRRAFLLMDPPPTWTDAQSASTKVSLARVGLVKDYSAIYFPQITITDNGLSRNIGPAGAMAGLYARIDSSRGVWKAPAGTEADIRGITGIQQKFTDADNGIMNPRAINVIRAFPTGIVSWGARTNYGDDNDANEYKYISIRRTALFIEESLYRSLKWVVFEPNDDTLWAQIRLNVGAFMNDLFRQGAFQGLVKSDAYFVKCDSETTTQNDIDLGIVNILVGFAPLYPAEFVILTIEQMAGNIQV